MFKNICYLIFDQNDNLAGYKTFGSYIISLGYCDMANTFPNLSHFSSDIMCLFNLQN